jgi:hypothetical protein
MSPFNFPPELLDIITSHSDIQTLKSIRLANRMLCSFATAHLFSEVQLFTEDDSCEAFESIITHPELKDRVQKVRLNTVDDDYVSDISLALTLYRAKYTAIQVYSNVS